MKNNRILDHPVLGKIAEQPPITFTFHNKTLVGVHGDTIASALMANGVRKLRVQESADTPRGICGNIGDGFDWRATVRKKSGVRAGRTVIDERMLVKRGPV